VVGPHGGQEIARPRHAGEVVEKEESQQQHAHRPRRVPEQNECVDRSELVGEDAERLERDVSTDCQRHAKLRIAQRYIVGPPLSVLSCLSSLSKNCGGTAAFDDSVARRLLRFDARRSRRFRTDADAPPAVAAGATDSTSSEGSANSSMVSMARGFGQGAGQRGLDRIAVMTSSNHRAPFLSGRSPSRREQGAALRHRVAAPSRGMVSSRGDHGGGEEEESV